MTTLPTIAQLRAQIQADIEAAYGSNIPPFGKNFIRVLSAVKAAKLWLIYKYIGSVQKNSFPDLADPEETGGTLQRWGRIKLNRNPFTAVAGQYIVNVTGDIGSVVKAKTVFKSNSDSSSPGKLFILDNEFILESVQDQMTLRALEPGVDSRLDVYDQLTSTIPIDDVNKTVTVASEFVTPLAAETIEEYRLRTVTSFRTEPQGGAGTDYREWAADVQGVRQVYPYAKSGFPGEVIVYIEATRINSTDGKGTPSSGMIDQVEEAINFDPDTTVTSRGRRPIQVVIDPQPVTIKSITIQIYGYENLTDTLRDQNEEALDELIDQIRPFIASAQPLDEKNDIINTNKIISTLLQVNPGAIFGQIVLRVDGVEVTTQTFINGNIPFLDSVTYV